MEINFKKKFGQNFLSDGNLLEGIVSDSGIDENTTVVEVGPGAGALTKKLAKKAKKVVAFEVDKDLEEPLKNNLSDFDNVQIIFKDFMKVENSEIRNLAGDTFAVVANLPYYITSPLITKFLTCGLSVQSITVMVQKEVGERIVACPKSKDYGVLSIMVGLCGTPKITRQVNRKMFTPAPNVDSCVVTIKNISVPENYADIVQFVKMCFSARRKTLVNNLSKTYDKAEIIKNLGVLNFNANVRAEELSCDDYIRFYRLFGKKN